MKAIKYMLAGGAGLAALAAATPASAQYYPNQGYGGGNVIGQVLGQILNPGYGGGYGMNSRVMVDRCAAAVTDRVNRQYGGYAYGGGYGGYGGYNNYGGGARVVAITSVERRSGSKVRVRGVAQTAAYGGGYGYGNGPQEIEFKCNIDYRGYISDIDLDRSRRYSNYGNPYQPYGSYRRY